MLLFRLGAAVGFYLTLSVAWADPTGSFRVQGSNPGGSGAYQGVVEVSRTGDTFKIVWRIGSDTFVGTGIGDGDFLAVSYVSSGSNTGLALYSRQERDNSWLGFWTTAGGTKLGQERWTPR